jgi:hypothetical protein
MSFEFEASLSIDGLIAIASGAITSIIAFLALRHSSRALSYAAESVQYTGKSYEYTVKSFERARAIEEVALAEGILRDVRALTKEFNTVYAEGPSDDDSGGEAFQQKLNMLADKIFGALNWYSLLVEMEQIQHPKLINYFRGAIVDWYDDAFVIFMPEAAKNPNSFPQLKALYKKYKNQTTSNNLEKEEKDKDKM